MNTQLAPSVLKKSNYSDGRRQAVIVDGHSLTIDQLVQVALYGTEVCLTESQETRRRIEASHEYIMAAVEANKPVYGVNTGFGGMANIMISAEDAAELQNNAIWYHKTATGRRLNNADVRAAMLLRVNSHLRGASGIRLELIGRMITFLNANVTPHVHEFGSIGASGDLVPLTYICGALIGLDASFMVDFDGQEMGAPEALRRLGIPPLQLRPKEGLAMINGTSVMTGIAARCISDTHTLLRLVMGTHALFIQALRGTNQSFHPFIHAHKPHQGQVWAANTMRKLLEDSRLSRDEIDGNSQTRENELFQDRYSLRCLPQFLGPVVEGLAHIAGQIEVEMNATSDNPLIDWENETTYHGGNFLGQYIGVGMDQLRYYLGLIAKHLDAQIALLVTPEFSNGLPPSLRGNSARQVNMGLKGLQITANSIMPLLTFYGNSLADRFPVHAEQFNQNINSQGYGSANLARQALEIFQQYLSIAVMFGLQAVDLRAHTSTGSYDARPCLSPATVPLYEAARTVVNRPPNSQRPYVWDDNERPLDRDIALITADIVNGGAILQALNKIDLLRSNHSDPERTIP